MNIWWCEEHRSVESAEEGICEVAARILLVPGPYPQPDYPTPCRIVEMLLISVSGLLHGPALFPPGHEFAGPQGLKDAAAAIDRKLGQKGLQ